MKSGWRRLVLTLTSLLSLCLGCARLGAGGQGGGSLSLALGYAPGAAARSIVPNFEVLIDSVRIDLEAAGEEGQTRLLDSPIGNIHFENLATATWTISVTVYKEAILLGTGSGFASVSPGSATTVRIPISFLGHDSGAGSLSLALAWPSVLGVDYLSWSLDGAPPSEALIAVDVLEGLCRTNLAASGLEAGSHYLSLSFRRGGASGRSAGVFVEALDLWSGLLSDRWMDEWGLVQAAWQFAAEDFLDPNADLAGLEITAVAGGDQTELDLAFSPSVTDYELGPCLFESLSFRALSSLPGQYLRYAWNGGEPAEIASGEDAPFLALADGIEGANRLEILVTAPDRETGRTYALSLAKAYRLRLDPQNGGAAEDLTIVSGTPASPPADPEYAGYRFEGWFTAPSGGAAWDFSQPLRANLELFGHWSPLSYPIDYSISLPSPGPLSFAGDLAVPYGAALNVSVLEAYPSYQWYLNGSALPGETGRAISLDSNDYAVATYSLMVIATDPLGIPASAWISVRFTR